MVWFGEPWHEGERMVLMCVLDVDRTFVIQAIIIGTVFFRLKNSSSTFYSRGGVLFLCVSFPPPPSTSSSTKLLLPYV